MGHDATADGRVAQLIGRRRPGCALEQAFYVDPEIFDRDMERIFMCGWLFVGHASRIARPGDYFLFEIGNESVIVSRAADGAVHALVNVCRHRGSRVCVSPEGSTRRFTCAYHGWSYDVDGTLVSARLMPEDFDLSSHGLKRIHVVVFHGLVYVNFHPGEVDFAGVHALDDCLEVFDLEHTVAAHREVYSVEANWKLAVENYTECYHCAPAHPEYSKLHTLKAPWEKSAPLRARMLERAVRCGVDVTVVDRRGNEMGPGSPDVFHGRSPLYDGCLSGTEDGARAAPLLGRISDYDGGATDISIGLSFFLAYSDYVVCYSFIPREVQRTDMEVTWLVREDAEEGRDYDRARLTWLWRVTSEADKRIIERNRAGIGSRYYEAGPYSPMESYTERFVSWYLDRIR